MSVAARRLVGRQSELGTIIGVLGASDRSTVAAVLAGEAGIGKTALWLAGIEAAENHGYRVLRCRPSEAETRFSFSGLTDLLDGASEILAELPPVQRSALRAALLLGEQPSRVDDRAVAAAFLAALRLLAGGSPVCVAVDDLQWLDAASLAALRYALARLADEPVVALLATRGDVPRWLDRAVSEQRRRTITVAGLDLAAIGELLRTRRGASFPRPVLVRLWQTSGGNPLFALELASALQRRSGRLGPGDVFPIPPSLAELLTARIAVISPAALEVAFAVALVADPTVTVLEAALGDVEDGLSEALRLDILELDGEHVRFAHPLLGSAILARQTPGSRRRLHARLAEVVTSAEERARHLAYATTTPTAEVAEVLEKAARKVFLGGAPVAAADLAEQAIRLTPASSPGDGLRRMLLAAGMHARAGDDDRGVALLRQALDAAAPGDERATVLAQLADVQVGRAAVELYQQALAEARDESIRATIHVGLAVKHRRMGGAARCLEHAQHAVDAAARTDDDAVRCRALAVYGSAHFMAGHGIATATMREAIAIERRSGDGFLRDGPTVQLGLQLHWSAQIEPGREVLLDLGRAAKASDDSHAEAGVLWALGMLEWRAGDWVRAERYIADSLELIRQLGAVEPVAELPAAVLAAHRGRVEQARDIARSALVRARTDGIGIAESSHSWVLGFVELSLGDADAALPHLRRSYEIRNDFMLEPAQRLELGDLLECLIATGRPDEAERILETWQERADRLDRAWSLAILARCRAMLLGARSDLDGALAGFDRAMAEHARSADPFSRGRTLLALGRVQRRFKRRGAARATLRDAMDVFERVGAPLWSERARAEIARVSGRSPVGSELTESEHRIAQLVAEGRTNREVAAALFLTEHTVETALTRVYRKLGVRSRVDLARRFGPNS